MFLANALKGKCPGSSSAFENWCCHIWIQYEKSFSTYHEKAVSRKIDGNTT